jgi:hypothetical protein
VPRPVAWLVVDYFAYVVRSGAPARYASRRRLLRLCRASCVSARCAARRRLLCLCRASGCHGMSHGSSRGSTSTTSTMPRVWVLGTSHGSSSTTSPTPRVRVPRHVARLIVDYFSHTAHLSASARRRLLRPRHASGCLGTLRGSSCSSSSTTSPMLCPGSLRGWSSTTSPMLCHRVPRLLARLVVDLAPSRRWTSPRSVALALAVRPVTPSRGSATRRSVALAQLPMSCIWKRRLRRSTSRRSVALVLAVRPVTPSRGSATHRSVAPALLHLCRAFGCVVFAARQLDSGHINSLPRQHG